MTPEPGAMVTTNVRLVELLGHGGMGSVWVAEHLGLEAKVAVKFIMPHLIEQMPTLRERFKREASICARLRSIHVVQVFDHGVVADGAPYIVMELLDGANLTDTVEKGGPRTPRQVSMIVSHVCKVLHRAHELGIVHRDIKPDNIFLSESDYELLVKVLDFGIAKHAEAASKDGVVTKTGVIVGSPEFMSPEQAISSKDVDHRTDLFSLAVVAYYALTGELPFEDDPDNPFWLRLSQGEYTPISKRRPALATLDTFFDKALQPKPESRFASARAFDEAFSAAVDQCPESGSVDLGSSIGEGLNVQAVRASAPTQLDSPASSSRARVEALQEEATLMMRPGDHPAPTPEPAPAPEPPPPPEPAPAPAHRLPEPSLPPRYPMASMAGPGEPQPPAEVPPWAAGQAERPGNPMLFLAIGASLALLVVFGLVAYLTWG
jgi:serine/threonine-protein kinase